MTEDESIGAANTAAPASLIQMMTGYWISQALYVAAKLGIADLLSDGPAKCDDLAATTGTHAASLHRTLRALASVSIFSEVTPGTFALTPMASLLRSGVPNSMRALAIMYAEERYQAWGEMLYSVRTGKPAFEHQFGMGLFDYLARDPQSGEVFNEAMTGWTSQVACTVSSIYDFSGNKTIIDIGGNRGTLLTAILQTHPDANGILFDLPDVVTEAETVLAASGLANRCKCIAGDFFAAVPAGGDVYLLSQILHDWDDERCLTILARCREAMPDHGKLLIVTLVVPPGDEPFFGKWLDLHMLVVTGGRERTAEEHRSLLHAGGFKLVRVLPTSIGPSLVEAVPV